MGKISLRRLLSPKPLALIAAAVLLVSSVPLISSALTVDELLGQGGGTTTTSTYPSITVTSSSNTSLLLKVTPLSFNGTNWTYQITWHRTLNAQGSVYVTLKSDKSQQVYSSDPASQNDDGNQTMTLSPSTGYRVEFWQQPGKGGSLLLRKFFTTLPAGAAATTTTTTTSSNSSGATSVADQLAANPNGPANCWSSNWTSVQQKYSDTINQKLTDYYTQKYGPTYAKLSGGLLNDNDINSIQLNCLPDNFTRLHGTFDNGANALAQKSNLVNKTTIGNGARYNMFQYYCGSADAHNSGAANGTNGSAAFLTPPPTASLCSNGATPSTPVLSFQYETTDKWFSMSQADNDVASSPHWDWTCTGAARPSQATKLSLVAGDGGNTAAPTQDAYSNWIDNRNGSYSHCAAPVYQLDMKYCGPDHEQDFGSSPLPKKGLCTNGATPSQVYFNSSGMQNFYGNAGNSTPAYWLCNGSDYASLCTAASSGGLSDTADLPDPVCSYNPDAKSGKCLNMSYTCLDSTVCSGNQTMTTVKDYSLPPAPPAVNTSSCLQGTLGCTR